jgi:hypothetical protein
VMAFLDFFGWVNILCITFPLPIHSWSQNNFKIWSKLTKKWIALRKRCIRSKRRLQTEPSQSLGPTHSLSVANQLGVTRSR